MGSCCFGNIAWRQIISFSLVGGFITVLSLMIYWFCLYTGIDYLLSNAAAFIITVAVAYVLNNKFTFRKTRKPVLSWRGLMKCYATYSLTGLVLASVLLWLWVRFFGINEMVAPLLNLLISVPVNFLMNKYWVYGKK